MSYDHRIAANKRSRVPTAGDRGRGLVARDVCVSVRTDICAERLPQSSFCRPLSTKAHAFSPRGAAPSREKKAWGYTPLVLVADL